jgi:catechol 2,3-dioxygenase-like lactoylglutathione lyase family enzyme
MKKLEYNGIDHLNINVKNLKKSKEFYHGLFDAKVREEGKNDYGEFALLEFRNGQVIALYQKDFENRLNHFGIHIKNFNQAQQIIDQLKVKNVYNDYIVYPESRSIYIEDPDGYQIELSERFAGVR